VEDAKGAHHRQLVDVVGEFVRLRGEADRYPTLASNRNVELSRANLTWCGLRAIRGRSRERYTASVVAPVGSVSFSGVGALRDGSPRSWPSGPDHWRLGLAHAGAIELSTVSDAGRSPVLLSPTSMSASHRCPRSGKRGEGDPELGADTAAVRALESHEPTVRPMPDGGTR